MARNENEILWPHRMRTLRAFLRKREDSAPEVGALWAVLYGYTVVDHATALAVAVECSESERTVGDVLEGWRPDALKVTP